MKATLRTAFLIAIFPMMLSGQIVTNPDSVYIGLYDTVWVDVLNNDYEMSNDSIYVTGASAFTVVGNRYLIIVADLLGQGKTGRMDTIYYQVAQVNGPNTATGSVYIDFMNQSVNVLNINNLNAQFNACGNHFWDLAGSSRFFAPGTTLKTPIFSNSFWIGGKHSSSSQLHLSAERFRQLGFDYSAGPISSQYDLLYDKKWNRVWKLTTAEVLYHIANYSAPNYVPIPDIADWPAHGDTTKGQLWNMAPFFDGNNNGVYEPLSGDYPLIRGNMSLFFVFNDVRYQNTESGGIPLGIEVHGMAYAFDQPATPMLHNAVFLHYDIINRSTYQYDDTWMGMFVDFDLGFAYDDFVGTDVYNGGIYCYNGTAVDGSGQPHAYGANPPTVGMQLLGGPFLAPDGLDNPKTDSLGQPLCNVSLIGTGFGDSIPDNERFGLSRSIFFDNTSMYNGDPVIPVEYYQYLTGSWRDGTKMLYGGNGHANSLAYGPVCDYIFPMASDSCDLGTGGIAPNGPKLWTEITAGNQPYDRRMLGSTGPVSFLPGASQPLDVVFLFAWNAINNASLDTLLDWFGEMKTLFSDQTSMFEPTLSVVSKFIPAKKNILLYPNPAQHSITLAGIGTAVPVPYQILSLAGQVVAAGYCLNGESIDVSALNTGLYFLRVVTSEGVNAVKFVKK